MRKRGRPRILVANLALTLEMKYRRKKEGGETSLLAFGEREGGRGN